MNHLLQTAIFVDNSIIQFRDKKNSSSLLKKVSDFKIRELTLWDDFTEYIREYYKGRLSHGEISSILDIIMFGGNDG